MPTQKKKDKKVKEKTDPEPAVNIKQEPEEIKPLAAYVDDRLELIRQVFSCVKPKEIKYLLPDFLEGKSNDIIKERCLDELLGISTKRLVSIINNTQCPTDTESENSDVENIEEHISLDEISSDSDVDAKRAGKRNKKADNTKQADGRNGEPKSEKEMTVLELLELQARARAIRSQLALEPVTKIEIDSEHEEDGAHGDLDTDDEAKLQTQKRNASKDASGSGENGKQMKQEQSSQPQTKRVRLKRNFRIRQVGDDDEDENDTSSNPSENVRAKSTEAAVEIVELTPEEPPVVEVEKTTPPREKEIPDESVAPPEEEKAETDGIPIEETTEKKDPETEIIEIPAPDPIPSEAVENVPASPKRDGDRESSPEVIPVEASPETLCISSDSEEERLAKERASIFVPNIEELDRQAKQKSAAPSPPKPTEDTEPEEGEISEEEPPVLPPAAQEAVSTVDEQETAEKDGTAKDADSSAGQAVATEGNQTDATAAAAGEHGTANDKTDSADVESGPAAKNDTAADSTEIHHLSSGSDESADGGSGNSSSSSSSSSSSDEEEENAKTEPPKLDNSGHDDEDIVEIHDSGDENLLLESEKPPEEEAKSWNSRWLKSNRVAKVMAASRLGNKVREKLKKQKQKQQAEQLEQTATEAAESAQPSPKAAETAATVSVELPANVELGSVEHYRELLAQRENKQD